jgi:hypothetical protein
LIARTRASPTWGFRGAQENRTLLHAMDPLGVMLGFSCRIVDDPLLDLAMAAPDPYPHADERRLFYVAPTPARRSVVLFTGGDESRRSSTNSSPTATPASSTIPTRRHPCPRCGDDGNVLARNGKHGRSGVASRHKQPPPVRACSGDCDIDGWTPARTGHQQLRLDAHAVGDRSMARRSAPAESVPLSV